MTLGSDPYAAFSSPVDNTGAADAAAPASAPAQDISAHVKALVDSHATKDQVHAFIRSQGQDPGSFTNLDANIDARDAELAQGVDKGAVVIPQEQGQAQAVQPDPGTAPQDTSDPYATFSAPVASEGADAAPAPTDQAQTAPEGIGGGVRNILEGGGDLLNTITSPIRVPMAAIGLPVDYAADASALADKLGLSHVDGVAGAIQKGMAQGLLTAGAGSALAAAPGAIGTVGSALAASPVADTISSGAAGGGGEAAKEAGYGETGQTLASLAAGGLGAVLTGRAVHAPGQPAPLTDAQRVGQAADRIGVTPFAGDVGGPAVRRIISGVAQTPFGGGPIVAAAQRVGTESQGVRDRVARTIGNALNPEAAGQRAVQGARSFIARTSNVGNGLYRRAEAMSNGVRVNPANALAALDRNIAEMSETPGGAAGLERLQGLRDALANGAPTVRGIRNMRTALRDEFTEAGLRGSDIERRVNQVTDAANDDVLHSLRAAGRPDAAQAYRVADRYWHQRLTTIDDVLGPIIGKDGDKSGEEVVKALQRAMAGNNQRFSQFIRALPHQEQSAVRASLIGRLGMASKGIQNEDGNVFSLASFLTHWNDIGETAKARLFGLEGRAALNDLATVANGAKQSARFANHSNTGGAIEVNRLLTYITTLPTLGANVAAQYSIGRLLASPRFARWLARAPRTAISGPAYVERLSRIAIAEPALAHDIAGLQQRLVQSFGPTQLAAQPDNRDRQ